MTNLNITFPDKAGMLPKFDMLKRYWDTYYSYMLNIFLRVGAKVELTGDTAVADGTFAMWLGEDELYVDYSDHLRPIRKDGIPCFKYHYSEGEHEEYSNMFPFPPVSFYDWGQYHLISEKVTYNAVGPLIVNRQRPYGNARERRKELQSKLKKRFGKRFVFRRIAQLAFWQEVQDCAVAVFAPGCRNNMLDRGHLQYFAFGCCTINPHIINVLPYFRKLVPGVHYIECKPDYSDVDDKVEWALTHRDECIRIGQNAKILFQKTCTPEYLIAWIQECIEKVKLNGKDIHINSCV